MAHPITDTLSRKWICLHSNSNSNINSNSNRLPAPASCGIPCCLAAATTSLCPISPKECLHSPNLIRHPGQYDPIFVQFQLQKKNVSSPIWGPTPSLLQPILLQWMWVRRLSGRKQKISCCNQIILHSTSSNPLSLESILNNIWVLNMQIWR